MPPRQWTKDEDNQIKLAALQGVKEGLTWKQMVDVAQKEMKTRSRVSIWNRIAKFLPRILAEVRRHRESAE